MNSRIFLSPPHMGGDEEKLVAEAFASNYVAPAGSMLNRFEQAFSQLTGVRYCLALSSGTAAMHLAMKSLALSPGDEVWASTLTFIASIGPAVHEGARPVFIDSDASTWTMDPELLGEGLEKASRLGRLPKAVIPTDIYGQSCDLDRIRCLCDPLGVPVISDSAEAVGASYRGRHAGHGARAAVYSFNGNKIITTSSGGMLASDDRDMIERARYLSTQARENVSHYEHQAVGFNYRLSNICAAIGLGQLGVLEQRVDRRRQVAARYQSNLKDCAGLSFMPEATYGRSTRWLTVMLVDPKAVPASPETLRSALEQQNIEARPVWKPMHMQPVFAAARTIGGAVSEKLFDQGLCLPSGSSMSDDDVDRVSAIVRATIHAH
ncbi:MAG: aminotransferase class I/II-fold pyridoxal phosphate-dependent enzyme [Micropepsaceae bacterium]